MYDGANLALWFSPPTGGSNDVPTFCLIVSVRLIDPAGRYIREPGVTVVRDSI